MPMETMIRQAFEAAADKAAFLDGLRALLNELSPFKAQPVDYVRWVPIEKVQANDYNPNSVARAEMGLLYISVKHDGYTQPCVTYYDAELDKYIIVDGFHRYFIMKTNDDIMQSTGGRLPVVVIDKSINERMASTVRHNRARGKHSVSGMSNMIFEMLENGWSDAEICNELGLQVEELVRLKHLTGFSKLFEDVEYRKAWQTRNQIRARCAYDAQQRFAAAQAEQAADISASDAISDDIIEDA